MPSFSLPLVICSHFIFQKRFHRVTGDGSSLFSACSITLVGDESLSVDLRCLTSIEMYTHSSYYSSHPYLYGHSLDGKQIDENSIFSNTLSQVTQDTFFNDDRIAAVIEEAKHIARNHSPASFLCLLVLSSVIGMTIECYYPIDGDTVKDLYELQFNVTVRTRPGNALHSHEKEIHLFRCALAPVDYLSTTSFPAKKDHFVPLMPLKPDAIELTVPSSFATRRIETTGVSHSSSSVARASASFTAATTLTDKRKQHKQLSIKDHFTAKISRSNTQESSSDVVPLAVVSSDDILSCPSSTSELPCSSSVQESFTVKSSKSAASHFGREISGSIICT